MNVPVDTADAAHQIVDINRIRTDGKTIGFIYRELNGDEYLGAVNRSNALADLLANADDESARKFRQSGINVFVILFGANRSRLLTAIGLAAQIQPCFTQNYLPHDG